MLMCLIGGSDSLNAYVTNWWIGGITCAADTCAGFPGNMSSCHEKRMTQDTAMHMAAVGPEKEGMHCIMAGQNTGKLCRLFASFEHSENSGQNLEKLQRSGGASVIILPKRLADGKGWQCHTTVVPKAYNIRPRQLTHTQKTKGQQLLTACRECAALIDIWNAQKGALFKHTSQEVKRKTSIKISNQTVAQMIYKAIKCPKRNLPGPVAAAPAATSAETMEYGSAFNGSNNSDITREPYEKEQRHAPATAGTTAEGSINTAPIPVITPAVIDRMAFQSNITQEATESERQDLRSAIMSRSRYQYRQQVCEDGAPPHIYGKETWQLKALMRLYMQVNTGSVTTTYAGYMIAAGEAEPKVIAFDDCGSSVIAKQPQGTTRFKARRILSLLGSSTPITGNADEAEFKIVNEPHRDDGLVLEKAEGDSCNIWYAHVTAFSGEEWMKTLASRMGLPWVAMPNRWLKTEGVLTADLISKCVWFPPHIYAWFIVCASLMWPERDAAAQEQFAFWKEFPLESLSTMLRNNTTNWCAPHDSSIGSEPCRRLLFPESQWAKMLTASGRESLKAMQNLLNSVSSCPTEPIVACHAGRQEASANLTQFDAVVSVAGSNKNYVRCTLSIHIPCRTRPKVADYAYEERKIKLRHDKAGETGVMTLSLSFWAGTYPQEGTQVAFVAGVAPGPDGSEATDPCQQCMLIAYVKQAIPPTRRTSTGSHAYSTTRKGGGLQSETHGMGSAASGSAASAAAVQAVCNASSDHQACTSGPTGSKQASSDETEAEDLSSAGSGISSEPAVAADIADIAHDAFDDSARVCEADICSTTRPMGVSMNFVLQAVALTTTGEEEHCWPGRTYSLFRRDPASWTRVCDIKPWYTGQVAVACKGDPGLRETLEVNTFYSRETGPIAVRVKIIAYTEGHWIVEAKARKEKNICMHSMIGALGWQEHAAVLFRPLQSTSVRWHAKQLANHGLIQAILDFRRVYQGHCLTKDGSCHWDVMLFKLHQHCHCVLDEAEPKFKKAFHIGDIIKYHGTDDEIVSIGAEYLVIAYAIDAMIVLPLAITSRPGKHDSPKAVSICSQDCWRAKTNAAWVFPARKDWPEVSGSCEVSSSRYECAKNIMEELLECSSKVEDVLGKHNKVVGFDIDHFEVGQPKQNEARTTQTNWIPHPPGGTGACSSDDICRFLKCGLKQVWKLGTRRTVPYWSNQQGKTHLVVAGQMSIYFREHGVNIVFQEALLKFLQDDPYSTSALFNPRTIREARIAREPGTQWCDTTDSAVDGKRLKFLGTSRRTTVLTSRLVHFLKTNEHAPAVLFFIVWRCKKVDILSSYRTIARIWNAVGGSKLFDVGTTWGLGASRDNGNNHFQMTLYQPKSEGEVTVQKPGVIRKLWENDPEDGDCSFHNPKMQANMSFTPFKTAWLLLLADENSRVENRWQDDIKRFEDGRVPVRSFSRSRARDMDNKSPDHPVSEAATASESSCAHDPKSHCGRASKVPIDPHDGSSSGVDGDSPRIGTARRQLSRNDGCINGKNVCYGNAILMLLSSTRLPTIISSHRLEKSPFISLVNTFFKRNLKRRTLAIEKQPAVPALLGRSVTDPIRVYAGEDFADDTKQHDAAEFLGKVIVALLASSQVTAGSGSDSEDESISTALKGMLKVRLTCGSKKCGARVYDEAFCVLRLRLVGTGEETDSLPDLIKDVMKDEKIKFNRPCEICESSWGTKEYTYEWPLLLTLQIGRYSTTEGTTSHKRFTKLEVPLHMQIPPGDTETATEYKFCGAVIHLGEHLATGHYYTILRDGNDPERWIRANDSVTTEISCVKALADASEAYLLMYEQSLRCGAHPDTTSHAHPDTVNDIFKTADAEVGDKTSADESMLKDSEEDTVQDSECGADGSPQPMTAKGIAKEYRSSSEGADCNDGNATAAGVTAAESDAGGNTSEGLFMMAVWYYDARPSDSKSWWHVGAAAAHKAVPGQMMVTFLNGSKQMTDYVDIRVYKWSRYQHHAEVTCKGVPVIAAYIRDGSPKRAVPLFYDNCWFCATIDSRDSDGTYTIVFAGEHHLKTQKGMQTQSFVRICGRYQPGSDSISPFSCTLIKKPLPPEPRSEGEVTSSHSNDEDMSISSAVGKTHQAHNSLPCNNTFLSSYLKRIGIPQVKSYGNLYHHMQQWILSNHLQLPQFNRHIIPKTLGGIVRSITMLSQGFLAFTQGDYKLTNLGKPKAEVQQLRVEVSEESRPFDTIAPSTRGMLVRTCLGLMEFYSNFHVCKLQGADVVKGLTLLESKLRLTGIHLELLPGKNRYMTSISKETRSPTEAQRAVCHMAYNCCMIVDQGNPEINEKVATRLREREKRDEAHSHVICIDTNEAGPELQVDRMLRLPKTSMACDPTVNLVRQISWCLPPNPRAQAQLAMATVMVTATDRGRSGTKYTIARIGRSGPFVTTKITSVMASVIPSTPPTGVPRREPSRGVAHAANTLSGNNPAGGETDAGTDDVAAGGTPASRNELRGVHLSEPCPWCAGAPGDGLDDAPLFGRPYCDVCTAELQKDISTGVRWKLCHLTLTQIREVVLESSLSFCQNQGLAQGRIRVEVLDGLMEQKHLDASLWPLPRVQKQNSLTMVTKCSTNLKMATLLSQVIVIAVYAVRCQNRSLCCSVAECWERLVEESGGAPASPSTPVPQHNSVKTVPCRIKVPASHHLYINDQNNLGTVQGNHGSTDETYLVLLDRGNQVLVSRSVIADLVQCHEDWLIEQLDGGLQLPNAFERSSVEPQWAIIGHLHKVLLADEGIHVPATSDSSASFQEAGKKMHMDRNGHQAGQLLTRIVYLANSRQRTTTQDVELEQLFALLKAHTKPGGSQPELLPMNLEPRIGSLFVRSHTGAEAQLRSNSAPGGTNRAARRRRRRPAGSHGRRRTPLCRANGRQQQNPEVNAPLPDELPSLHCPALGVVMGRHQARSSTYGDVDRELWTVAPLMGDGPNELLTTAELGPRIRLFEIFCIKHHFCYPRQHPHNPVHLETIARHALGIQETKDLVARCCHVDEVVSIALLEGGRTHGKIRIGVFDSVKTRLKELGVDEQYGLPQQESVVMTLLRYGLFPQSTSQGPGNYMGLFTKDTIDQLDPAELVLLQVYLMCSCGQHISAKDRTKRSRIMRQRLAELMCADGTAQPPPHTHGAAGIRQIILGESAVPPPRHPWAASSDQVSEDAVTAMEEERKLDQLDEAVRRLGKQKVGRYLQMNEPAALRMIKEIDLGIALAWRWQEAHGSSPSITVLKHLNERISSLVPGGSLHAEDARLALPGKYYLVGDLAGYADIEVKGLVDFFRDKDGASLAVLFAFEMIALGAKRTAHIEALQAKRARMENGSIRRPEKLFETILRAIKKCEGIGPWYTVLRLRERHTFDPWVQKCIRGCLRIHLPWQYICAWCYRPVWGSGVKYGRPYYFCSSLTAPGSSCKCKYLCRGCYTQEYFKKFKKHWRDRHEMIISNGRHQTDQDQDAAESDGHSSSDGSGADGEDGNTGNDDTSQAGLPVSQANSADRHDDMDNGDVGSSIPSKASDKPDDSGETHTAIHDGGLEVPSRQTVSLPLLEAFEWTCARLQIPQSDLKEVAESQGASLSAFVQYRSTEEGMSGSWQVSVNFSGEILTKSVAYLYEKSMHPCRIMRWCAAFEKQQAACTPTHAFQHDDPTPDELNLFGWVGHMISIPTNDFGDGWAKHTFGEDWATKDNCLRSMLYARIVEMVSLTDREARKWTVLVCYDGSTYCKDALWLYQHAGQALKMHVHNHVRDMRSCKRPMRINASNTDSQQESGRRPRHSQSARNLGSRSKTQVRREHFNLSESKPRYSGGVPPYRDTTQSELDEEEDGGEDGDEEAGLREHDVRADVLDKLRRAQGFFVTEAEERGASTNNNSTRGDASEEEKQLTESELRESDNATEDGIGHVSKRPRYSKLTGQPGYWRELCPAECTPTDGKHVTVDGKDYLQARDGFKVKKFFVGKPYVGTARFLKAASDDPADEDWWKVTYGDGDAEDLNEDEMNAARQEFEPFEMTAAH